MLRLNILKLKARKKQHLKMNINYASYFITNKSLVSFYSSTLAQIFWSEVHMICGTLVKIEIADIQSKPFLILLKYDKSC